MLIHVKTIDLALLLDDNINQLTEISTMVTRSTIALAVAILFLGAPVMAQGTSNKDSNAHHYQGGPQTGVPHVAKHPKNANAKVRTKSGGHHYSGGPKTESHHMGEKK